MGCYGQWIRLPQMPSMPTILSVSSVHWNFITSPAAGFPNTMRKSGEKTSPYNFAYFVLTDDRAHLYERIDRRVDLMVEQGTC